VNTIFPCIFVRMLKSMTGFGKASTNIDDKIINVEIKSLNSQKGLDLTVKLPSKYRAFEYELRNHLASLLQRGKIDVFVSLEHNTASSEISINRELIISYFNEFKSIAAEVGVSTERLLPTILQMPDVIGESHEEPSEEELNAIRQAVFMAAKEVNAFRESEGKATLADLLQRIRNIETLAAKIKDEDPRRVKEIRDRLYHNLEQFIPTDKIDPNRFEQEVIYYLEKLDISEELTRLQAHCAHFMQEAESVEDVKGRKLNFIAQEIGREINTIGSKANDAAMQKLVVSMKDELEKIKEQTNNVL
ncbi:MAG: YicC family protein, partial [Chitinophagales bacterium]|nr:YicC family protein [Chitinophagales bacterium]MDW8419504.1 YicC/YloC family endoribonuclease [Chitinophagales bacterium]